MITKVLKGAVSLCAENLYFLPKGILDRSLWAARAMALLCSGIDTDIIRLIGRWRSDEMLRYLHLQAEPLMRGFSKRMVTHGNYSMLPGQRVPDVPCYYLVLLFKLFTIPASIRCLPHPYFLAYGDTRPLLRGDASHTRPPSQEVPSSSGRVERFQANSVNFC